MGIVCGKNPTKNHKKWYSEENRKIVIVGLPSSGKTTFCHKISKQSFLTHYDPTKVITEYRVTYDDQKWSLVDTPGETRLRMFWPHQYIGAHAIMFIVDASEEED